LILRFHYNVKHFFNFSRRPH